MKRILIRILALILSISFIMPKVVAPVEAESNGESVTSFSQLQTALNNAKTKGTASNPYVVTVTKSMDVTIMLQIFDNTKLVLNSGVVLKRGSSLSDPMLMTYRDSKGNTGTGGYDRASNITVSGGIWDGNNANANIMHFVHMQNLTIENVTFQNCTASHALILDGVNNATVKNSQFNNIVANASLHENERFVNEALHIDACTDSTAAGGAEPFDGTISKNITVSNCTFNNVITGVGNHKHNGTNKVQTGITISNNTFKKVAETCINAVSTSGTKITGNTASKSGAKVFVRLHGTTGVTISSNTVDTVSTFAWAYKDTTITTASTGTISKNTVSNAGGKDTDVNGNIIELAALQLSNGNKFTVSENIIKNSKYAALQLLGTTNSNITSNEFNNAYVSSNSNAYAILILGGSNETAFKNNIVTNNKGGGIFAKQSNKVAIIQNDINHSAKYPVSFSGVTDCSATGNAFQKGVDGHQESSTGTTIKDNKLSASASVVVPTGGSTAKNGFLKDSDGKWKYFVNGKVDTSYNNLAKNQYGWFKVTKGVHDASYTGLAKNQYGWFYVKAGKVDQTYTGLVKRPENGKWYYVTKGKWDQTFNDLAKNQYGWYKVTKGEVDFTYTGLAKNKYGWHYTTKGKFDPNFTGVGKNQYGYFYVKKGKLDLTFNGVAKDAAGKWYNVKQGKATPR